MDPTTPSPPGTPSLATDLDSLRTQLVRARSSQSPPTDELVQALETAYEELRVANEEIRTQHDAIQRLVESHQGLRLQHERTMAMLPVPIVVTDMLGIVRSVNAAATTLVEARAARLLGKPVFGFFVPSERLDLRRLVATHNRPGLAFDHEATLLTRGGDRVPVQATVSVQGPGAGDEEISWILMVGSDRLAHRSRSVARALTQLAMLPQDGATRSEVLQAAVVACREGLDRRAELSLVIGSPLEPAEVHSSSQAAQHWDGAQVACGQGPSDTCFREGAATASTDLRTDPRWPLLADRLTGGEVGAVAVPIVPSDEVVGTLTAYVGSGHVELDVVDVFAVTLGGVLRELELRDELRRLEEEMRRALASRAVIDQAKGIIMADRGIDADAAWDHLVHLSSVQHVKVRDMAEEIVSRAARAG